jgi:hypothetical protein
MLASSGSASVVLPKGGMMLKKLWISAAAVALPLAMVGVVGATPAFGSVPTITANGTVTCTTLGGKIGFSPALHTTGTSNTDTSSIKVKLSGCSTTSTNLPAGSVITGTATSKIVTTTTDNSANACGGLATSRSSVQTVKWSDKSSSGVALAHLTNSVVSFSGFDVLVNGSGEPGFDLPQDTGGTASATGSFIGTNNGATSEANIFAKKTATQITTTCGKATGMASLALGGPGTASDPSHSVVS